MFRQLVEPNTNTQDGAGWCLRFTQTVYGAPARYNSAWDAWQAVPDKHTDPLPEASVPVWFSHYGTYGNPPTYANWGHVVAKIGDRFLSSPASGVGQQWFDSVEAIEKTFNAKYVGWSESLNGLKIVEYVSTGSSQEMYLVKTTDGRGLLVREYDIQQIQDPGEFEILGRILASNPKDPDTFVGQQIEFIAKYLTPPKMQMPDIQINVDAIAQAIADKIDCGGGVDVTTKDEILEAIQANYPEDK
jgi:hypothetical protein